MAILHNGIILSLEETYGLWNANESLAGVDEDNYSGVHELLGSAPMVALIPSLWWIQKVLRWQREQHHMSVQCVSSIWICPVLSTGRGRHGRPLIKDGIVNNEGWYADTKVVQTFHLVPVQLPITLPHDLWVVTQMLECYVLFVWLFFLYGFASGRGVIQQVLKCVDVWYSLLLIHSHTCNTQQRLTTFLSGQLLCNECIRPDLTYFI